ncbi:exosortase/archaeosortase family protein [Candidatus Marsarchaeota archaeon]|nr:exosortase/archaeosortase family protein [Candidatus Marsarchaeota archaeon]
MKYDSRIAFAVLFISLLFAIANMIMTTSFTISDTDPSTYVIVPLLMIPLLALFMSKKRIHPNVKKSDVAFGALGMAIFIIAMIYLSILFSFAFTSYKIEMLIFPLFACSLVILLFGTRNINNMRPLIIYPIVASPILLIPIIRLNQGFAALNTKLVYATLSAFAKISYIAPTTISANGINISIGQSCVGIGALIAIALFLIPVAYFYDGENSKKVLWIISSVVLVMLLNFIRMLGIAAAWLFGGPNDAILSIHLVAGILLFYASIIIMFLIAKKYDLDMPHYGRKMVFKATSQQKAGIFIAVFSSVLILAFTMNYYTSLTVSPSLLSSSSAFNFTNQSIVRLSDTQLNLSGFITLTATNGNSAAVILSNKSMEQYPIIVYLTNQNANITKELLSNNTVLGDAIFFNNDSVTSRVYDIVSNSTEFFVYQSSFPYSENSYSSSIISVYAVMHNTSITNQTCPSYYDGFYTSASDLFSKTGNYSEQRRLEGAYCILNRLIKE